MKRLIIVTAVGALFSGAVLAQQGTVQRDVNQQNRIEQGLQSGQLNTKEASKLESEQAHIQREQSRDLKNGNLSPAEKQRLAREQNQASRDINRLESNKATGNPNSASSKRMQADVQRNANQQARIEQGVKSGSMTNREAGRAEKGQATVTSAEAKAGRNGHVSKGEQRHVQTAENKQSDRIYREKHNAAKK
jgi:hypothetical protein